MQLERGGQEDNVLGSSSRPRKGEMDLSHLLTFTVGVYPRGDREGAQ